MQRIVQTRETPHSELSHLKCAGAPVRVAISRRISCGLLYFGRRGELKKFVPFRNTIQVIAPLNRYENVRIVRGMAWGWSRLMNI